MAIELPPVRSASPRSELGAARSAVLSAARAAALSVPSRRCRLAGAAVAGVLLLALAGCPTVDLGDSPPDVGLCRPDRQYYIDVIWPRFLAPATPARSCVGATGCHEAQSGRSALRLSTNVPTEHDRNYQIVTRFLNCSTPLASELLTKPLAGVEAHQGGDIFPSSADAAVVDFQGWFPQ